MNVDLDSQGGSQDEALENIKEALALHFEDKVADRPSMMAAPASCQITHVEVVTAAKAKEINDQSMSFRSVRFKLETAGFVGISQSRNHAKFIKAGTDPTLTAILPHYVELAPSVFSSVARQAKLPLAYFRDREEL